MYLLQKKCRWGKNIEKMIGKWINNQNVEFIHYLLSVFFAMKGKIFIPILKKKYDHG
jgi:hypothetical protein